VLAYDCGLINALPSAYSAYSSNELRGVGKYTVDELFLAWTDLEVTRGRVSCMGLEWTIDTD
jgi:hypothetical protein